MTTRAHVLMFSLLLGCGGAQSGSDSCQAAGGNVGKAYRSQFNTTDAHAAELARIMTERCDADRWSDAATRCLINLQPTTGRLDDCASTWTPEQTQRLEREVKDFEQRVRASAGS